MKTKCMKENQNNGTKWNGMDNMTHIIQHNCMEVNGMEPMEHIGWNTCRTSRKAIEHNCFEQNGTTKCRRIEQYQTWLNK